MAVLLFYPKTTWFLLSWGLFLESPDNFLGPESCFRCAVFAFNIKISVVLKIIQWNYQLTKQKWLISELGTVTPFSWFWFQNLPLHPKSYLAFRETGPRTVNQFCVKQFTHSFLHFSSFSLRPTIRNYWGLRTSTRDIKTFRSKGENHATTNSTFIY